MGESTGMGQEIRNNLSDVFSSSNFNSLRYSNLYTSFNLGEGARGREIVCPTHNEEGIYKCEICSGLRLICPRPRARMGAREGGESAQRTRAVGRVIEDSGEKEGKEGPDENGGSKRYCMVGGDSKKWRKNGGTLQQPAFSNPNINFVQTPSFGPQGAIAHPKDPKPHHSQAPELQSTVRVI
jgi:hypothetical protein